ncbi:hypothetical protein EDD18DRAFT_1172220 [Armillaria luteobubalina]|uniref:Uncharacterized protein n=1 Tax=Armillaria luteobubalina TaxID=153913 RepID=A0AA39USF9_9AGAR|nr:hypothetical protein EDD18DRAFT_1172220 [Armillaria luteobubalina]
MAEDERINDEPKLPIEGEIASSVLEHVHEVNATQEELLGQADASSTIPAVKEAPVAVTVPPPGPEVHAVIASTQEPEVEHVVKEEPAESIIDIRAVPTVPEPGNDLEPTVEDDTVSVGKHQEVTTSSSEPARDMEATVNGKQAEEGHKEEVVLTAPELEYVVESSVKDETVVSEPLTTVGEKESKGGERVISHAQVLVDEIKSVLKDEPGDEEATSRIPASIEKEQQAETGHIRSPEVESVVNDELVREEDANLPSSVSTHDSKPALEDMSVEDKTELHVEKALSSVPEPILQNAAPEAGRETESAVKEEAFEDEHNEHNDHIVSPAPVSVAKEEYDEQIVPPAEESLAEGETAGEEHQQAAIVYDSEQQIDTVVEDKQVQDVPVVQDELVKEGQDNENILASSEPAVEDKHSQEPVAAPLPKLEREIESVAVDEPVANDIVESVVAPEPEPYVERVVEAKVEHVATPAPDLHHEIETVEKEVEESAEIVLDEQVALPVPEPESAVAEDETIASPAPANDELIEVPVTKEVLGPQDDATLPAPEAEPRSVAISEEGQIEVVREIEPAEEVETGHGAAEEEHDDQEASTVLAKDEPTHAEQVAVLVPETDQRTEVVVHAKEAEDRPVSPELVAEDGLDKDGHDEKAVLQDEKPSGHDEEIAPPAPEVDTLAKEESLEDEQATSSTSQPTPVSKEDPAVAESVPEKEVKEPVPEPAVVQGEVIIPPAPEPATETKPLEEVALAAPELHSAVEEKSLEDDQTLSPAAQPAPALKEQVDVEPVPELQQETKAVGKEVDEPVADIQEQLTAPEPAVVEEEPVISPAPEPATEIKSLVVEAEEGIESVVKDEDQPAVPPVAEIKNEPVISPTPELVTEAKFLEPTAEPDVEEQAVVPVAVSLAPEIVAEVESVDEASAERYVEPKAEDVQVEIKSAVKDEQVEDKPEEPIAPEREPVSSEQAASPEPQQEQAEKIEVELAKEEPFEPVVKEEQVEAVASEEKTSLDEQVHVEPAEEASDDKLEAEPTAKDEDVEENTIDSRELSVDTSSFADSTKSPWTPSHSMTTQDVGSPDAEMKKDLPGRAFPVTEEDRKSVGSLDTVNESADVVPETLEVPFTRKRLESSASARLLRGALHKVPEGRASLDMAQGEFTKLPSPVVVDTTHTSTVGVAETPTAEQEPASASTDDSDGSSDDSSEAEHKGRWCVVM